MFGLFIAAALAHQSRPAGEAGEAADQLAREVEAAIHAGAWAKTRALRWSFAGLRHHVWDRDHDRVRLIVVRVGVHGLVQAAEEETV